ncbi:unnamed protein product [Rhodiola kirilowii]
MAFEQTRRSSSGRLHQRGVKGISGNGVSEVDSQGVNVKYENRKNRNGYKAGALKEGLSKQYVSDCEYVVIFAADFQPGKDFLWRTIPFFMKNPELGLVQTRWKFGTAGVWKVQAINDAGGWKDRTTVEDMELAVRASLKGWKFLFVGDVAVKNELPSTYKAYRFQQHRWSLVIFLNRLAGLE